MFSFFTILQWKMCALFGFVQNIPVGLLLDNDLPLSLQRVMFGIWIQWRWSPSQATRQYRKPWVWHWCKILLPSQPLSISRCLHRESHWQITKESKQGRGGKVICVLMHCVTFCWLVFPSCVLQSLIQMITGLSKEWQYLLSFMVVSGLYWRMYILKCVEVAFPTDTVSKCAVFRKKLYF